MPARERRKRLYAVVLGGALLIVLFVGIAFGDIGEPDVPDGAVAVVEDAPDGTIGQDEFDRGLEQAAARQGLDEVPAPGEQDYEALRDLAMSDIILSRWVRGEAEERGITVAETEIQSELENLKKQEFGGEEGFQKFLDQSGFTEEDALDRVELSLLSQRVEDDVLPDQPEIDDSDVEDFYEQNKAQFEQPESRDFRVILNKDEAQAQEAADLLTADDSEASWDKVAKEFSTDAGTQDSGGLRKNVAQGQSEPALDQAVFAAQPDQVVGPFEGEAGFYVIEVIEVTPAQTTPLSEVSEQIRQQLVAAAQQEVAADFQNDFIAKWTSRTFCADGYVSDRCENFAPPSDSCDGDDPDEKSKNLETAGCPTVVPSTRPAAPGTAGIIGGSAAPALPQGPLTPVAPAADQQVPVPLGSPGAPPVQGAPAAPGG